MIYMINHHNFSEKMQRTQEYIEALEEERRKIQVFQRELPLCLDLVIQGTFHSHFVCFSSNSIFLWVFFFFF